MDNVTPIGGADRRTREREERERSSAENGKFIARIINGTLLRMAVKELSQLADEWDSNSYSESQRAALYQAVDWISYAEVFFNNRLNGGSPRA